MGLWLMSITLFALAGAISPGPVNVLSASFANRYGYQRTFAYVGGASIAYALVVLLSALLMAQLGQWLPQLTTPLKLLATLYLSYLALQIACAPVQSFDTGETVLAPRFYHGVLCQSLNPKAWLVALTGCGLFIHGESLGLKILLFTLVSLVICLIGVGSWALLGELLRRYLAKSAQQRMVNWSIALMLWLSVFNLWQWELT